jgi:Tol biopolymer transport system component
MNMKSIAAVIALILLTALSAIQVSAQSGYDLFQKALAAERADGNLRQAIQLYERVVKDAGRDRALAARALIRMAECYQRLGDSQARHLYERVVREFGDQGESAAAARTHLQALSPASTDLARQAAKQVWSGDGVDGSGTPSADGRYLSFTDWETGDLAVRDLVTNTSRHLTNTGGWNASGDFADYSVMSPDGRLIAYNWYIDKDRQTELRLISLAPGEPARPRTVLQGTKPTDYIAPVGIMPDAGAILTLRTLPDRTNQIGVVSVRDGSYRSIKSLDWRYPKRVSLSPDGRYLAYDAPAGDNGSPRDIFVLAIDGSRESVVVSGTADDSRPLWTPDGTRLLFLSDRTGPSLWSVPVENSRATSAPVLLKADIGDIGLLGITRGGELIYQVAGRTRQNIYMAPWDGAKVTGRPTLVTEQFVNSSSGPAWSPDGQSLAFYSWRSRPALVIRSMVTGTERTVATPTGLFAPFQSGPIWFPDSQSMLIVVNDSQGSGRAFYRLHIDSGKVDLLHRLDTPRPFSPGSFALSPDGNSIFWAVQQTSDDYWPSGRLLRFDLVTNREMILKSDEGFITVAVSPDGKQLAYVKSMRLGTSTIEVMPTAGGEAREVFRSAKWYDGSRYNTLGWTPDSKSIMFVNQDGNLWRVPNTGGEPQQVGVELTKTRIKTPTIDPAGKRLAFGAVEADNNEIWSLEHFLPVTVAKRVP